MAGFHRPEPPDPILVVDLFPEERQSLLELLAGLSDEQWAARTVCPSWSVKDIALHLLGVDIGIVSRKRDDFHDESLATPGTDLTQWTQLVPYLNHINELWVQSTRRISPRLLCELLRFTGQAVDAFFQSLEPMALGGQVSWAGPEPAPVWLDLAREYTERWVHQQQIRDAVGRPGLKSPRWLTPVLETFVWALPHTLRDATAPIGTCVELTITGEAGGDWHAERLAAGWALGKGPGLALDATVAIDQDIAWRLFTRGMSKEEARKTAVLTGNTSLAERVLDMVSIIA